jgi:hypothetical protein
MKEGGVRKKERKGMREEVVAGFIYLLCVGLSLLPVGIMKTINVHNSYVAFASYVLASFSLIFFLLEFLLFFINEVDNEK